MHPLNLCDMVVINLEKDRERFVVFMESAKNVGLADYIRRLDAIEVKDKDKYKDIFSNVQFMGRGDVGCYLSHLKACKEFLDGDKKYLVIFEDDAFFRSNAYEDLVDLICWMEAKFEGGKVDVVHLGAIPERLGWTEVFRLPDNEVGRLLHPKMGAHGVLLSRRGARCLLEMKEKTIIDVDLFARPKDFGAWPYTLKRPIVNINPSYASTTSTINSKNVGLSGNITKKHKKTFWGLEWENIRYSIRENGIYDTAKMIAFHFYIMMFRYMRIRRRVYPYKYR